VSDLANRFATQFGPPGPAYLISAPGRVNLIGEHIDYAGLPVLPMAVQRQVRVLVRPRADRTVRVANRDPAFPQRTFTIAGSIDPFPVGDWGNYIKAAVQHVEQRHGPIGGFDALVDSALPVAAGLSSSSALVIATALAALAESRRDVPTLDLAEGLAVAEQYVGTHGGGMDQAISLGARKGAAAKIEFAPLRVTYVPVPGEWRFVVASSLVAAEKSGAVQAAYNSRRRDVETALALLVSDAARWPDITSYQEVVALPPAEIDAAISAIADATLRRRFRHVVREGVRVLQAEQAMQRSDMDVFGRLMCASHASLRDDFEVSRAELNVMVDIALEAGAVGARLTGAGFGGCIVALSDRGTADDVVSALRERYYGSRSVPDDLDNFLFVTEPSGGASVSEL
jgi:galactokinase